MWQVLFPEMTDLRRNCLTLILGATLYFICYGMLREYPLFGFFKVLRDFWWYLALVDVVAMGLIYRSYYGRSIVHELTDTGEGEGLWDYEDEKHKYKRTDLADKQQFFDGKLKTVNKIEDTLDQAQTKMTEIDERVEHVDKIKDKVGTLEENLENLQTAFLYRPEGELADKMADEVLGDLQM